MNKPIYATFDEKFVKASILFSSEGKIYYGKNCDEEVTLEDALNLFKKGFMLVSVDDGFKRPTGISVTEDGYTISYGGEVSPVVPEPTLEQEGYILKVVSGTPTWVSDT